LVEEVYKSAVLAYALLNHTKCFHVNISEEYQAWFICNIAIFLELRGL